MSARRVHRWRDRFVAGLRIGEIADARAPLTQFDRTDYVGGQMYAQGRAYVPQVVDALRQVVAITVETRYEFGERLGPEAVADYGVVLTGPEDVPVVDGEATGRLRGDLRAGRPDVRSFFDRGSAYGVLSG